MNLTTNFQLKEVYEWPKHQANMTPADKAKATELAKKALNSTTQSHAKIAAVELQRLRGQVNKEFPEFSGNIKIVALSWLRPVEWEHYRKRSGKSQHIYGHGVDFIFEAPGATRDDINKMMAWAWNNYTGSWPGGLARLKRFGNYSFIHLDHRTGRARWEY